MAPSETRTLVVTSEAGGLSEWVGRVTVALPQEHRGWSTSAECVWGGAGGRAVLREALGPGSATPVQAAGGLGRPAPGQCVSGSDCAISECSGLL